MPEGSLMVPEHLSHWARRVLASLVEGDADGAATGPTANACTGNLRPGQYALAKTPMGVDFHLLSVHLDTGRAGRDYEYRRQAT